MKKVLYAAVIIFPLLVLIIFPKWTVDDAYIYYRYADNLAKYGELNWNVGESPVEGYTGVALPVLLAGFIKAGGSPVTGSHILGVLAYILGFVMLFLILRRLKLSHAGRFFGLFFYSATPIIFTHVLSGLDTMLFISGILTTLYAFMWVLEDSGRKTLKEVSLLLSALLLGFVRPEGLAFGGLCVAVAAYVKLRRNRGELLWYLAKSFLVYFIPTVLYFWWRFDYYGQLLPNTFFVKTNVGFSISNLMDLARFLIRYFTAPLAACVLLFAADPDALWRKIKNGQTIPNIRHAFMLLAPYFIFIVLLLIQFSHAHLNMNYAYRFYLPILPALWITSALFFDWGWSALNSIKAARPVAQKFTMIFITVLFAYQASFYLAKLKEEIRFARDEKLSLEGQHIAIGKFLKEKIPASEWIVVYIDAGAIPYFSGLKTVDFGGLNDRYLAKNSQNLEEKIDYFYAHNPGAVVFTSESRDSLVYGDEAEAITKDKRFKKYSLVKKYFSPTAPPRNYHEFLFVRNDLATKLK